MRLYCKVMVILIGMTRKVGPKGQVVIPKEIRDRLGMRPGDRVSFWCDGEAVSIRRIDDIRSLIGIFADGPSLTGDLMAERRADREREEARLAAFRVSQAEFDADARTR